MVFQKAITFEDHQVAKKVIFASTKPEALVLAQTLKDEVLLRQPKGQIGNEDSGEHRWNTEYMRKDLFDVTYLKFTANEDIKAKLLETRKRTLVDKTDYKKTGGLGIAAREQTPLYVERTRSLLGETLMRVREQIRSEEFGSGSKWRVYVH